jgi:hypothetical protein
MMPASLRNLARGRAALALVCVASIASGVAAGWFAHGAYASARENEAAPAAKCRDEVTSVDNAHGAVSCSSADMTSEMKDGYLICKCRKK